MTILEAFIVRSYKKDCGFHNIFQHFCWCSSGLLRKAISDGTCMLQVWLSSHTSNSSRQVLWFTAESCCNVRRICIICCDRFGVSPTLSKITSGVLFLTSRLANSSVILHICGCVCVHLCAPMSLHCEALLLHVPLISHPPLWNVFSSSCPFLLHLSLLFHPRFLCVCVFMCEHIAVLNAGSSWKLYSVAALSCII